MQTMPMRDASCSDALLRRRTCALSVLLFAGIVHLFMDNIARAQFVELLERDAVVWLHEQTVDGKAGGGITSGLVYVNGQQHEFAVQNGRFKVEVRLQETENLLTACSPDGVCSDTLRWTLGYELRPEAYARADASGRTVTLSADLIENPTGGAVTYRWSADPDNPAPTSIADSDTPGAMVEIPSDAPPGEYYFDVRVTPRDGPESIARTFVTADSTSIMPFDIETDHASWVDDAVIFEITPYIFEENGGLRNVLDRIEEIAALGVNTIWLQPIFETHFGGQGYDVTNYFEVRPDYGTKTDLRALVDRAHELGMKVLLDFVPNHTSSEHPYALDVVEHGPASHYHTYYLHDEDDADYSMHYRRRSIGQADFVHYFWENLLLIDHDHPEVQRWMIEAGRYWIEQFDVDGYRIDAVWGTNARTPEMMQRWRHALKRYKPEVLLLGEDKATEPSSFDGRFDAAYDWYPGEVWVSHWTWQTDFSETQNLTMFNDASGSSRIDLIRDALTNRGDGWHPDAKVLRFMENNDTFRFLEHHSVAASRMAASFLFSLPGIPLVYNGQEIGRTGHPYTSFVVYFNGRSIEEQSRFGLHSHYQRLINVRAAFDALRSDHIEEIEASHAGVFAYHRWHGRQHVFAVVNPTETFLTTTLSLPVHSLSVDRNETYFLTDQISGDVYEVPGSKLASVAIDMPATFTRILVLGDRRVHVGTEAGTPEIPNRLTLAQNFPNPFNPSTTLTFTLPGTGHVSLRVFDLLGREVASLIDETMSRGEHTIRFDGAGLATGVYVYRMSSGDQVISRKMLLLR